MLLGLLQARIRLLAGTQVDGFLLFQQMFRMYRAALSFDLLKAIIGLCNRMQCIGSRALYGQLRQAERPHRQDGRSLLQALIAISLPAQMTPAGAGHAMRYICMAYTAEPRPLAPVPRHTHHITLPLFYLHKPYLIPINTEIYR